MRQRWQCLVCFFVKFQDEVFAVESAFLMVFLYDVFFPGDCVFFVLKRVVVHRCCSFLATLGNSSECCISRL